MTGKTGVTPGGLLKREWSHKKIDFTFWQSMNKGNKSWHTGTWNKKLKTLADGKNKASIGNVTVRARCRYILDHRDRNVGPLTRPVKGIGFFPFEEDLSHHIREALVNVSTGSPLQFFSNPFVKDWLSNLEPRHRPVHRLKLCRLIRCVIDVTGMEVSTALVDVCCMSYKSHSFSL